MSRNNLLARGATAGPSLGQPLLPPQIGMTQYMQPPLEKLYWERSPSGSYSATANYIRTSIPPNAASQATQWSPLRQPVIPYHSSFTQGPPPHIMTAQIPTEYIHTGPPATQVTSPYYTNTLMIGQPQIVHGPGGAYLSQQYQQAGPYLNNQHFNVTTTQYERETDVAGGAQMIATGATQSNLKNAVSLSTPAIISSRTLSRTGMTQEQQQHAGGTTKIETNQTAPPPVEEVEEEFTMIDSPQHLPPVPGTARSAVEQHQAAMMLNTQNITTTNVIPSFAQTGAMTTRASPSRLTYEAPGMVQAPLTDRVILSSRHHRVTSSPATISPREPLGASFLTGMQQNISSDLLRIGLFWPVLNPLIDMLRLIEVVDYRSSTSFKSIVLAVSPDSSVKDLLIQFGDTHELLMRLDPVTVSSLNGLALIKCALKEEEIITIKSATTGNSFKISVKQLLLSGLTACQGKYLLSDTEHIKFGIQLSFNACASDQSAPVVCVCPQSIHYEVKTLTPPNNSSPDAGIAELAGGYSQKLTTTGGPEPVVVPRHTRDLSADCIKGNRPISSTKLFLPDGTPSYNRLLVKVEGFEGFEDVPRDIPSVYLRASLGGGTKGYRCKVDNWLGEEAHAEFDFDYRGNRTIKFSIINATETNSTDPKEVIGTTQLNLLALLSLSKNQFRGSLPVNSEGRVLGRLKVGALFTNASTTAPTPTSFKAFSWAQALIGGTFIKITLHNLQGSLQSAHDPLFFRVSCAGVKVRSAKFTPSKTAKSMDLKDETMELPITPELLAASEQKDFILCVYSRYNAETLCHTASHYVKILPSVIDLPCSIPRMTRVDNAIMTPAAQEYAAEDFLITFTFGVHK